MEESWQIVYCKATGSSKLVLKTAGKKVSETFAERLRLKEVSFQVVYDRPTDRPNNELPETTIAKIFE